MKLPPHYRPGHTEWDKFFQQLSKVKSRGFPVCLSGENGVGKDFCSRLLRSALGVAEGQADVIAAEGPGPLPAATPDSPKKVAYFVQEGGLSPERQKEILRFLETAGSRLQVIWTGRQSLQSQMEEGLLSEELFYALNIFDYRLPGLAAMPDDVEGFANHFLIEICAEASLRQARLGADEVRLLKKQAWAANLDTLHYILRRSAAQSAGSEFELNLSLLPMSRSGKDADPNASEHEGVISGVPVDRLEKSVNEFKKKLVIETLKKAGGNKSNAAKLLGVSKAYIFRLIQVLDIDLD